MGTATRYVCGTCGTRFTARQGGGFSFDELHCEDCGTLVSVGHPELGDLHLRYVKGLPGPYAIARSEGDRQIQRDYPGAPLDRAGHHAAVEATLEPCACGGRFRYDAPPRCPGCRSTPDVWVRDRTGGRTFYD